jgi:molybdopterin molybdotransferase
VPVHRAPRIAVLATGDELVPVSDRPGPGQIRNSNEAMLVAQ